jgi:WD40 repeat protein
MQTAIKYRSFPHHAYINSAAFSADGKLLLTDTKSMLDAEAVGSELHCWNVETGEEVYRWKPQVGFTGAVAFNPQNPNIVALTSFERDLRIPNEPRDPRLRAIIKKYNAGIELWDGTNLIQRFNYFTQFYRECTDELEERILHFSRDGKTLYGCLQCGGMPPQKRVFATEYLGSGDSRLVTEPGECSDHLELNRQENYLAVSNVSAGRLTVRHLDSGKVIYSDIDDVYLPYCLDFDGEGQMLVVGRMRAGQSSTKVVEIIDVARGKLLRKLTTRAVRFFAVFSPDNRILAVEMYQDEDASMESIVLWGIPQ